MAKAKRQQPFNQMVEEMKKGNNESTNGSKVKEAKKLHIGIHTTARKVLLVEHTANGNKKEYVLPTAKIGKPLSSAAFRKTGINFNVGKKINGGAYEDKRGPVHGEVFLLEPSVKITDANLPSNCVLVNINDVMRDKKHNGIELSPLTAHVLSLCKRHL